MIDLSRRVLTPELMDQPELDSALHRQALTALRRINRLSRTSGIIWRALARIAKIRRHSPPLRVLDLACGGGDVVMGVARRAARAHVPLEIAGADISPVALEFAAERAAQSGLQQVTFFRCDVQSDTLPADYDVVMCSLFLHHLHDEAAERLLANMARAARLAVLVSDLRRSRLGYTMAVVGARLLTQSPVVRFDGPISVRAAWTCEEVRAMAKRAGLTSAIVRPCWPERYLLSWMR